MTVAAIETSGLGKRYGRVAALTDLSLRVEAGEVLGFLGPNGAGKTTTIRLLLGLARPSSGSARIFGADCTNDPVTAHRRVGYVPGEANLWPALTGAQTLHLLARVNGPFDERYRDELIERFRFDPRPRVRTYSHGNRQKLLLIAALMTRPDLLLLDEPTNGLDPLMEAAFRRCVAEARDRGQAVFLSSHILSEVEALCDRVGILRAGRLVEVGTLEQMRHLAALTVEVHFDGPAPNVEQVPGVSAVRTDGSVLHCQVRGSFSPLLQALSGSGVRQLLSREPSLEELFLSRYGASDVAGEPAGAR